MLCSYLLREMTKGVDNNKFYVFAIKKRYLLKVVFMEKTWTIPLYFSVDYFFKKMYFFASNYACIIYVKNTIFRQKSIAYLNPLKTHKTRPRYIRVNLNIEWFSCDFSHYVDLCAEMNHKIWKMFTKITLF